MRLRLSCLAHHHALGELELEATGGETRALEDRGDHLGQLGVLELARRKVDGQAQIRPFQFGLPVAHLKAGGLDRPIADGKDEPSLFG